MLVTTFYLAMTFINAWRMRSLKSHLLKFMSWKSSAVLYKLPSGVSLIKSKLVIEQKVHCITDIVEINERSRMCRLRPIQCIDVNRWFSVADGVPLWPNNIFQELDSNPKLGVFIECEMDPGTDNAHNDIVHLESLGQVWAWRAYNNLELIVIIPFNNILELSYKFLYGTLKINHGLPVVRIQTVYAAGIPYRADSHQMHPVKSIIRNHYEKSQQPIDWAYYAGVLKQTSSEILSSVRVPGRSKTDTSANIPAQTEDKKIDEKITDLHENLGNTNKGNSEALIKEEQTPEILKVWTLDHTENVEKDLRGLLAEDGVQSFKELPTYTQNNTVKLHEAQAALSRQETTMTIEKPKKIPISVSVQTQEGTRTLTQEPASALSQDHTRKLKREPALEQQQERTTEFTKQDLTPHRTKREKREPTPEPVPGPSNMVVRSETVAIHQRLSPSRKTNKGNIATTIKSVTTHTRVTSTIPPSQGKQSSSASLDSSFNKMSLNGSPRRKIDLTKSKSLNVLVYSESLVAKNNLIATLQNVLDPDRYTIYPVTLEVICEGVWRGNVALIAVVGNTGPATPYLVKHFLDGGRLLAICSDLLQAVVPYYRTAEIRENEIVQFTYDKWKSVKMKHHVLCFQASPAKKQFSSDSDRHVMEHEIAVDVLAREETWRTPSLVQVVGERNNGISIFSQIHLETNPAEYLGEEGPRTDRDRYEILLNVLGEVIKLYVRDRDQIPKVEYTEGYLFGDDEILKSQLPDLCPNRNERVSKLNGLTMEWVFGDQPPSQPASRDYLPVRVRRVPESFSYQTYHQNLTSSELGRAVLYTDVVGTTVVWNEFPLFHGLAVVAGRQLHGQGRSNNHFISPLGQAIMSLQMWVTLSDTMALIQNAAALAAVLALRSGTPYDRLNIRIKWPNDIYFGREAKLGGIMTKAQYMDGRARINVGIGLNISNSVPTTCVNDLIDRHNCASDVQLEHVTVEWFLARFCSHLEQILDSIRTKPGLHAFFDEYYKYWLHDKEKIEIINRNGSRVFGVVHGIDSMGFLVVDTSAGQVTVNPDGNSFDIMTNLIVTKP